MNIGEYLRQKELAQTDTPKERCPQKPKKVVTLFFGRPGCPHFISEGGKTQFPCADYSRIKCSNPCKSQVIYERGIQDLRRMADNFLPRSR